MRYEHRTAAGEFAAECKKEDEQLKFLEESQRYENIIAKLSDTQLVLEQAIVDNEEAMLYSKKKALKAEFRRRLRGD